MLKQLEEKWPSLIQFIKFGIVGVSNTIVNYVIYLLSLHVLEVWRGEQRFDYLIAQIIAFLLSVLWSFFWNYKYVFAQKEKSLGEIVKQLMKAYISYSVTGVFLNSILLFVEIDVFEMSKVLAPVINIFISVPINFLMNKYFTFGQKK